LIPHLHRPATLSSAALDSSGPPEA
jgi:hypothetical protein